MKNGYHAPLYFKVHNCGGLISIASSISQMKRVFINLRLMDFPYGHS